MGLFNEMLGSDESLFKNEESLDTEFLPKELQYRENQQKQLALAIKPLLARRNGKNLFIYGAPGIGKTAATKFVLRDLEEETDEIIPIYINCWQKNTTYKIAVDICSQIGYVFTQNKKTDELFKKIEEIINKASAVFVFDEVDKVEDFDFIYNLIEGIYRKSIFLVTNFKEWIMDLDDRIKSRLMPDTLEFKEYNLNETEGVLKTRRGYAFHDNCWDEDAFSIIVKKTYEVRDIRRGLQLMRKTGMIAEDMSSRKIEKVHAEKAVKEADEFSIKNPNDLEEDTRMILSVAKEHYGKKIGEIYKKYKSKGGASSYKTFQRKMAKLAQNKFISVNKLSGGSEGTTTIIDSPDKIKTLDDF